MRFLSPPAPYFFMAYTSQAEIEAVLPPKFLTDALDDDASGAADTGLLTAFLGVIDNEIDGMITPTVELPLATTPARIKTAALVLACEGLYRRRGIHDDANPWSKRAETVREDLVKVGRGELAIDADSALVGGFTDHTLDFDPEADS